MVHKVNNQVFTGVAASADYLTNKFPSLPVFLTAGAASVLINYHIDLIKTFKQTLTLVEQQNFQLTNSAILV